MSTQTAHALLMGLALTFATSRGVYLVMRPRVRPSVQIMVANAVSWTLWAFVVLALTPEIGRLAATIGVLVLLVSQAAWVVLDVAGHALRKMLERRSMHRRALEDRPHPAQ